MPGMETEIDEEETDWMDELKDAKEEMNQELKEVKSLKEIMEDSESTSTETTIRVLEEAREIRDILSDHKETVRAITVSGIMKGGGLTGHEMEQIGKYFDEVEKLEKSHNDIMDKINEIIPRDEREIDAATVDDIADVASFDLDEWKELQTEKQEKEGFNLDSLSEGTIEALIEFKKLKEEKEDLKN